MNNIYVISDTHLGHTNIIKYCNRPFKTVEEMNNTIIVNWNKTVTNDDIIIHCGDFVLGSSEDIRNYANQLNGKKILIRDNHDRKGIGFFESCGFQVIREKYYTLAINKSNNLHKYIFSHAPLDNNLIPKGFINLHGHIHNYPLDNKFNKETHKCISCECINYTPLKLS